MGTNVREIIESYDPKRQLATASTAPSSWYTDPSILELERQTVFSRAWQCAGRTAQVREPGQFVSCEIAGEPILVVGSENVLRAFFNVCRHHAAAIVTERQGKTENLRCPYHGWT